MSDLDPQSKEPRAKWPPRWFISLLVAIPVGFAAYQFLTHTHREQSAALFIGLPTLIAITMIYVPSGGLVTINMLRGIVGFTAFSFLALGEGAVCVLFALPLFGGIGLLVGIGVDLAAWQAKRIDEENERGSRRGMLTLVPLILMSFEGATDWLSFNRHEVVRVERMLEVSSAEVAERLAQAPSLPLELPFILRLGFPMPQHFEREGTEMGDTMSIHFAGGEGSPGDLTLRVAERAPGVIEWNAEEDTSHVAHWLDWKTSRVEWKKIDETHTLVTWTLTYDRLLDPAWWFGPWERYVAGLTGELLIDTCANPAYGE